MKIKVGDIVRVKNWGNSWNTCTSWFLEHSKELKPEWMINYKYGDWEKFNKYYGERDDDEKYEVLYVDSIGEKVLIRSYDEDTIELEKEVGFLGSTYLLGLKAVELYDGEPVEMTVTEIEKRLGIRNLKIIGEK